MKEKEQLRYITNNMRSYRNRLGYTQEKMADLLNISRATYCDYEVNPSSVRIEVFKKMADILKCSLVDFFIPHNVTESEHSNLELAKSENDS